MVRTPKLSLREKILAVSAGALLIIFAVTGYVQASKSGLLTGILVAQETTTETTTKIIPAVSTEDRSNQERTVKDQQSYISNIRRELEDIKRDASGLNTSVIDGKLAEFETCITGRQAEIGTDVFWENWQKCSDYTRDIEDEMNLNLRVQRRCTELHKNIEDRKREKKNNIDRQMKDLLRNNPNADVSAINQYISQIEAGFTKADALTTCNEDISNQLDDIRAGFDGLFQDFYYTFNELNDKANQVRQTQENKKDFDRNIKRQCEKDLARELKNFEREVARWQKSGTFTQAAQDAYSKVKAIYAHLCTELIATMQQALDTGDADTFNYTRDDFNSSTRDFWDELQVAREQGNIQQQIKDITREITQREKEFTNMKKEYQRAVKKAGSELPKAAGFLSQMEQLLAQAKEAIKNDPQVWWNEYQQDFNDLQNEFWDRLRQVNEITDVQRWMKDIEKEVGFREKDLKNIKKNKNLDKNILAELDDLMAEMKNLVAQAKQVLAEDPEEARDLLHSMDDLRMEWDDTTRSMWARQQMQFEVEKTQREIEYAEKAMKDMLRAGRINQGEFDECQEFLTEVKTEILPNLNPEDEDIGKELEQKAMEVCPFLEEIGDAPPPDRAYYQDFVRKNAKGLDQGAMEVLQQVSEDVVEKIVMRLMTDPSVINDLIQAAGDRYKTAASDTLEAATNFYNEDAQRDVLQKKAEILELTKQLENLTGQIQVAQSKLAELQKIQDEIAGYNFYGNAGNTIRTEMEKFIAEAKSAGLSQTEIQKKIDEFKVKGEQAMAESKQAKYENKIIPFMDTDDNVWYTKYVAPLARLGVVRGKGDGTNFDPAANVTVAEVLTMAFRISGDSEPSGNSKLCNGAFANHWGNRFVLWAEQKGLSLTKTCTNLDRPALRWEVAQALLETAHKNIGDSADTCFNDVRVTDKLVNNVVCAAKSNGILSGVNGNSNAYNKVIRAEAATMIKQTAEKLLGVKFAAPAPAAVKSKQTGTSKVKQPTAEKYFTPSAPVAPEPEEEPSYYEEESDEDYSYDDEEDIDYGEEEDYEEDEAF